MIWPASWASLKRRGTVIVLWAKCLSITMMLAGEQLALAFRHATHTNLLFHLREKQSFPHLPLQYYHKQFDIWDSRWQTSQYPPLALLSKNPISLGITFLDTSIPFSVSISTIWFVVKWWSASVYLQSKSYSTRSLIFCSVVLAMHLISLPTITCLAYCINNYVIFSINIQVVFCRNIVHESTTKTLQTCG